jgi:hypothetical protein
MSNDTNNRPTQKPGTIRYAIEPCSRCGGSGHYSYCQRFGTTCFKCGGKGIQRTRAAKAAARKVEAIKARHTTTKLALDILPGDRIMVDGKVLTVDTTEVSASFVTREEYAAQVNVTINTTRPVNQAIDCVGQVWPCKSFGGAAHREVTLAHTKAQRAAILAEAGKLRSKAITVIPAEEV